MTKIEEVVANILCARRQCVSEAEDGVLHHAPRIHVREIAARMPAFAPHAGSMELESEVGERSAAGHRRGPPVLQDGSAGLWPATVFRPDAAVRTRGFAGHRRAVQLADTGVAGRERGPMARNSASARCNGAFERGGGP